MRKAIFATLLIVCTMAIAPFISTAFACGGKITGGGQCIVDGNMDIPSASFGFNVMAPLNAAGPEEVKGELNYVDHTTGKHLHAHEMIYVETWEYEEDNKPWPLRQGAFWGPCEYDGEETTFFCHIYDLGEPGTDDMFFILVGPDISFGPDGVSGGTYLGGSETVPILVGNIQIHKAPTGQQPLPT